MKEKFLNLFFLLCLAVANISCSNGAHTKDPYDFFKEVSIDITKKKKSDNSESVSRNVSIYTMNNRTDTGFKVSNKYKMAYKVIDGQAYTRVDFDSNYNGNIFRSVVSNSKETVVFDSNSSEILYRFPVNQTESSVFDFLSCSPISGKICLSDIKENAYRLSLDVVEEDNQKVSINIPENMLNNLASDNIISARVSFDVATETMSDIELVMEEREGVTVTTNQTYVYQKYNDEIVKVGCITVINTEDKNLIEDIPEDYPCYESVDDIPELSETEYLKLKEAGNIYDEQDLVFGNPADRSSVETVVEVYDSVSLNTVDNSVFKLILE